VNNRKCGNCTKCCEGYLSGEALGHTFYPGKPCHFIAIGKGCSIYSKRPTDPCATYQCSWLNNSDIPEWLKPSDIDAIIDERKIKDITFLNLKEAGSPMQAKVLNWFFQHILATGTNALWQVNGGLNWAGSIEFNAAMELENQKGAS